MIDFQKEKNLLKKHLGSDIVTLLKTSRAVLAGGAITSIFSGKEINDFDIYFRSYEDLIIFIKNVYNKENLLEEDEWCDQYFSLICVNHTNRSILFTKDNVKLQAIHFSFYEQPEDIFKSFDFTINMAAYDFKDDKFIFHEDFFKDLAQRRLTFNPKTDYPIISSLRVSKYLDRGYKISKKEMFKISLAIADTKIDSWNKLEDHLSGFYGVDVSKLFDKNQEFSLVNAIDMLDKVEEDVTHKIGYSSTNYRNLINSINLYHDIENTQTIFYKKVKEKDGKFVSPQVSHGALTYITGEKINGGYRGVYAFESKTEAVNSYYRGEHVAILEVESRENVLDDGDDGAVRLTGDVKVLDIYKIDF
jgi:hypothetical protein